MLNAISVTDERSLHGHYKGRDLKDSDAIYAEKLALLKMPKTQKLMYYIMLGVMTFIFLFLVALAGTFYVLVVYLPMAAIFIWLIKRSSKRIKMINAGTISYCNQLGVAPA